MHHCPWFGESRLESLRVGGTQPAGGGGGRSWWDGEALVVWEPFETIPNVLVRGQRGNGVIWLQRVLGELGVYSGAATGTFDESTERSVRILQADAMLEPDGAVGPRTQMVLYEKLPRYDVPRLKSKEGSG